MESIDGRMGRLELAHGVLEANVHAELKQINEKLDRLLKGEGANCIRHSDRIDQLEHWQKKVDTHTTWLWRTAIGALLFSLLGYILDLMLRR